MPKRNPQLTRSQVRDDIRRKNANGIQPGLYKAKFDVVVERKIKGNEFNSSFTFPRGNFVQILCASYHDYRLHLEVLCTEFCGVVIVDRRFSKWFERV